MQSLKSRNNNSMTLKPALTHDPPLSSSIPLPKSHIHRTPSELQLVDDTRRADYEDARLYARLVAGMRSRCLATGYVHPLTRKSLLGIYQTKQATDDEDTEEIRINPQDQEEDYQDWELSYVEDQDESTFVDMSWLCHPLRTT